MCSPLMNISGDGTLSEIHQWKCNRLLSNDDQCKKYADQRKEGDNFAHHVFRIEYIERSRSINIAGR